MAGRVQDKIALVTGGASGIGRGCALRLAEEGAIVVVSDIDDALGETTTNDIRNAGGQAEYLHHDVTDEDAWRNVVETIRSHHGGLNILVNNAGIGIGGSILDLSLADWQRQQAINLDGVFLGVKHCIPLMRDSGNGSIINMSSVAGLKGSANLSAYNATKGGVRLFTKGVALECGQQRWPIRVNSVHPGIIDTPITRNARLVGEMDKPEKRVEMVEGYQRRGYTPDRVARNILKAVEKNRLVAPISPEAWALYYMKRFAPWLLRRIGLVLARRTRRGSV